MREQDEWTALESMQRLEKVSVVLTASLVLRFPLPIDENKFLALAPNMESALFSVELDPSSELRLLSTNLERLSSST
jgi:hypothetical protein